VPVLTNIAAIGDPGEDVESLRPDGAAQAGTASEPAARPPVAEVAITASAATLQIEPPKISPRARNLAARQALDMGQLKGTGPDGRIIERDVQAALAQRPPMTPLARTMAAQGGFSLPERGSGVRGRIMAEDLQPVSPPAVEMPTGTPEAEVETIPVRGIRKVIAARMLESLQTTAQLTMNASADARALLAYRKRLKESPDALGLQKITLNDLILFAVSRILLQYPELNALFAGDTISRYKDVHLGLAVDTPRGLMVPVIRQAQTLSLKQLSQEAGRLAAACLEGTITPAELSGGTFTVTNLGNLGIESFTPILNPPQVAILGAGNINLKPVEVDGQVQFIQYIGLSLTINHQVVDGAPAARFLQAVSQGLANIDMMLAL
jgi:pyruvate dehydrogenase E2 component (dihydrolipoamide acetyltransferase)